MALGFRLRPDRYAKGSAGVSSMAHRRAAVDSDRLNFREFKRECVRKGGRGWRLKV